MIALTRNVWTVEDLMSRLQLDVDRLAEVTGVDAKVVEAIVQLRYTPSLQDRLRISAVLGVDRSQIHGNGLNRIHGVEKRVLFGKNRIGQREKVEHILRERHTG